MLVLKKKKGSRGGISTYMQIHIQHMSDEYMQINTSKHS